MALLGVLGFTTAVTDYTTDSVVSPDLGSPYALSYQIRFMPTGGGTTCQVMLDTTLDEKLTWLEIARLDFTTTAAIGLGTIGGNATFNPALYTTLSSGQARIFLGRYFRFRITTTGTYSAGSQVRIDYVSRAN